MCWKLSFLNLILISLTLLCCTCIWGETVFNLRAGKDLELICNHSPTINTTIALWTNPKNKTVRGASLILRNASFTDSGKYTCTSYYTSTLQFNKSYIVNVQDVPKPPIDIMLEALSEHSLNVSWSPGYDGNSPILMYSLSLDNGSGIFTTKNITAPRCDTSFQNLKPYTCYSLVIQSLNDVGWSELSLPHKASTLPGVPTIQPDVRLVNVTNHSITVEINTSNVLQTRQQDSRLCPDHDVRYIPWIYGPLKSYDVSIITSHSPQTISKQLPATSSNPEVLSIKDLRPFTTYNISFAFHNGRFSGPSSHFRFSTLEGIPDQPRLVTFQATADSLSLKWADGAKNNGKIIKYKLKLYNCSFNKPSHGKRFTRLQLVELDGDKKYYTFTNLNADECYAARVTAATKVGFGDYSNYFIMRTQNKISPDQRRLQSVVQNQFKLDNSALGWIISVTLLVFISVTLAACFASRMRQLFNMCYTNAICYRMADNPNKYRRITPFRLNKTMYKTIPSQEFRNYTTNCHADEDTSFKSEFQAIEQALQTDWSTHVARSPENIAKNRYSNILAYDHTRVVLKETGQKSDYINANYVDGYHRRAAYIAAQGPTPTTFDDFWLMVWEQDSNVIVMISNFIERGRRKCDKYWPSVGSHQVYGNISVRMISESVRAFFTVRVFAIRHIKCKRSLRDRVVYHYQYTDWRDFDVPPSPLPVLKFVEISIMHWSLDKGPIIVHCSAGVGRTGTYICIESLIRQLRVEHTVSVRGFLEHIRQQRMKLVQTEQQYAFIHDALCEFILYPCHSIRPQHFSDYISHLNEIDSAGVSNMQKQFEMCIDTGYRTEVSSHSVNDVTQFSACTNNSGIDSSALHGFQNVREYVVTQHPVDELETHFWKLVWDANSSIIVCLSDQDMPPFWPDQSEQTRNIGWLHVNFISQDKYSDSLIRFCFLLTSDREDYALGCTLWRFYLWPTVELEDPLQSRVASELLDLTTHLTENESGSSGSNAPIIVVDNSGGFRVGTFCALRILFKQLICDFLLDVYFVFKMICLQRQGVFRSYHDLEFLYILIQHYLLNASYLSSHGASATNDSNYSSLAFIQDSNHTSKSIISHNRPTTKHIMNNIFTVGHKLSNLKPLCSSFPNGSLFFNRQNSLSINSRHSISDEESCMGNEDMSVTSCFHQKSNAVDCEALQKQPLLFPNGTSHHFVPCKHSSLFPLLSSGRKSLEFLFHGSNSQHKPNMNKSARPEYPTL